jgi:hypothetical protein
MLLKKIYNHIIKGSWEIKKLYLTAFFYMAYIRFCMFFVKYSWYESSMGKRGVGHDEIVLNETHQLYIKKVRTVVQAVSKYTLWESKCMVQALSAKWLLQKYHIPSTIFFGVFKDTQENKLKAHAWLKINDFVITGAAGHQKFKVVNFYS